MQKPSRVLGVIPARGGSKGVPQKNTCLVGGKPLICYTIETALACSTLDRVIVSTDDPSIAEIARAAGAEVPFLRPAALAEDTTHTPPVIAHAVRYLEEHEGYTVDLVVTLQPTSPLRRQEHISQAVATLQHNPALDSVMTVCQAEFPPFWMLTLEAGRLVPFVNNAADYFLLERQQLPPVYRPNGAVYVTRRELLLTAGVVIGKHVGAVIMEAESSLDVDTPLDLQLLELVLADGERHRHKAAEVTRL
jgi:CMP-N,N'-diacetyllegionaminic acid synthase